MPRLRVGARAVPSPMSLSRRFWTMSTTLCATHKRRIGTNKSHKEVDLQRGLSFPVGIPSHSLWHRIEYSPEYLMQLSVVVAAHPVGGVLSEACLI